MRLENLLICNMDVFTSAEREDHLRATAELYHSAINITETENGFEFLFANKSENILRLAEFISNERLCCQFLEFTLRISPNGKPISLLLTGPEGTKEFLQVELHEAFE